MADDPVFMMIGVAALGTGVVMLYAAYKNVPVFGKNGIITQALETGSFANVKQLPNLFGGTGSSGSQSFSAVLPGDVQQALQQIASKQPKLADDIDSALEQMMNGDPAFSSAGLSTLLQQASSAGFPGQAGVINSFVHGFKPASNTGTGTTQGVWT